MKKSHQSSKLKLASLTAVLLVVGAFSANAAFAEGALDTLGKAIFPGAAPVLDQLDQANGDYGHPTEAAGAAILEHFLTLLP